MKKGEQIPFSSISTMLSQLMEQIAHSLPTSTSSQAQGDLDTTLSSLKGLHDFLKTDFDQGAIMSLEGILDHLSDIMPVSSSQITAIKTDIKKLTTLKEALEELNKVVLPLDFDLSAVDAFCQKPLIEIEQADLMALNRALTHKTMLATPPSSDFEHVHALLEKAEEALNSMVPVTQSPRVEPVPPPMPVKFSRISSSASIPSTAPIHLSGMGLTEEVSVYEKMRTPRRILRVMPDGAFERWLNQNIETIHTTRDLSLILSLKGILSNRFITPFDAINMANFIKSSLKRAPAGAPQGFFHQTQRELTQLATTLLSWGYSSVSKPQPPQPKSP